MNTEAQRKSLLALRTEIADDLANLKGSHETREGDETPTGPDSSGRDADAATVLFERERDMALAAELQSKLIQIDRAIQRIAAGGYGTCARCGKPIGVERLRAVPYATLCVADQEIEERF